jgi:Endonuclease I/Secretion system C-terminal sorting domain
VVIQTYHHFHIYPVDRKLNSDFRGDLPLGETINPSDISLNGGSKKGPSSFSGIPSTTTVFEPIDEYKGDFARTYFYIVTRYGSKLGTGYGSEVKSWASLSTEGGIVLDGTSFPAFNQPYLKMLLKWHNQDPVSQKEKERNNNVFIIQNNRNPFIDFPEYVNDIWGNYLGKDLTLVTLNPNPNPTTVTVKEGATIHRYYQIKNIMGTLFSGVVVQYKIKDKIYNSLPSDDNGVIDLNIKLSGEKPEDLNDDIVRANNTAEVTFEGFKDLCPNSLVNSQFEKFNIVVEPFEGDDVQYSLFGSLGASGSVCAGCLSWGNYGVNGVGLSLSAINGFKLAWNKNNIFTLIGSSEAMIRTYANLISIPSKNINVDVASAYLKPHFQGEISNIRFNDEIQYLRLLSIILRSSSDFNHNIHYLADGLDIILSKVGTTTSNFGSGTAIGLDFGYYLDGNLALKGYVPSLVNFENQPITIKNFDKNAGIEIGQSRSYDGINFTHFKHFDKYQVKSFKGNLGQYLDLPMDNERFYEHLVNYIIQSKNNLRIDGVFNHTRNGEVPVSIDGTLKTTNFAQEFDYKFGSEALNLINSKVKERGNLIYDNGTGKLLTGNGSIVPLLFSGLVSNSNAHFNSFQTLKDYVESNYNSDWTFPQLQTTDRRKYAYTASRKFDFPVSPVPTKIGPFGFGLDVLIELASSVSSVYPTATKVYHPKLQRLISLVEYPQTNTFVNLPNDPANDFIKNIKDALLRNMINIVTQITDDVGGIFQNAVANTGLGIGWELLNSARKTLLLKAPRTTSALSVLETTATKFSTLTFSGKDTTTAFDNGTKLNLSYYYPRGEVKAKMTTRDTAVIISDIFYFQAVKGTDTLSRTPRSVFNIKAHLAAEDLITLGLDSTANLQLIYQGFKDSLWQNLGTLSLRQNDKDFKCDKLGVYSIAMTLKTDTIAPNIKITAAPNLRKSDSISVNITDTQSGVNWRSVTVLVNGANVAWKRTGISSTIKVAVADLPNLTDGERIIEVNAKDLNANYGHTLATLSIATSTIEFHSSLIKLYPNPTKGELNIVWNLPKTSDAEFIVSDILGKIVYKSTQKSGSDVQNTVLDMHHLAQGTYLLSIKQAGRILDTRKFMKL